MAQVETSIAILWDAENVNPRSQRSLVDAVIDYAGRFGRLSVAFAFGDWTRRALKGSDEILARASFQLIHIPKGRKNSADISMVTSGMELLFQYPHVTTYVMVTGDSDFRPLLVNMRRRGAETAIICDAQSASEDLLALADHYRDYRDLFSDDDTAEAAPDQKEGKESLTRDQAFGLLAEAVSIMERNRKTPTLGPTKIRLTLLDENFDEGTLGYSSWKSFVLDAKEHGYVDIQTRESDLVLSLPASRKRSEEQISEPLSSFLTAVEKAAGQRNEEASFAALGKACKELNLDYREHGYRSLKRLAKAAEKRGLVELTNRGLEWYVRLSEQAAGRNRKGA
jgi:hypothetical protein